MDVELATIQTLWSSCKIHRKITVLISGIAVDASWLKLVLAVAYVWLCVRGSGISWEVAGIFIFSIIAILGVATLRVAIPKCMVPILAQDACWDAEVMRTKEHGQDLNSIHFESTRQNKVYLYMCYTQFHEKIIERQDNLNHEVYPTYEDGCKCRWWVLHQQKTK